MRFATYRRAAKTCTAVVVDDELVDLPDGADLAALLPLGLDALLEAGGRALRARSNVRPFAGVDLAPPLTPRSFRDFMTFEQHIDGAVKNQGPQATIVPAWYDAPAFYFSNPEAMIGAHDDVALPPGCRELDFELEVAAVLGGRCGRDLDLDAAAQAIVGYTILNDWSARDLQLREMQVGLGPAKGKDFASTLGPMLVTADELAPRNRDGFLDLRMRADVGSRTIGTDSLAQMAWSFPELVVYSSRGAPVVAGDVFGSGTCGGGCLAEMRGRFGPEAYNWLGAGDVVTLSVECLGTLRNRVVGPMTPPQPISSARRRTWDVGTPPAIVAP